MKKAQASVIFTGLFSKITVHGFGLVAVPLSILIFTLL
jgi:hypothetical protein